MQILIISPEDTVLRRIRSASPPPAQPDLARAETLDQALRLLGQDRFDAVLVDLAFSDPRRFTSYLR